MNFFFSITIHKIIIYIKHHTDISYFSFFLSFLSKHKFYYNYMFFFSLCIVYGLLKHDRKRLIKSDKGNSGAEVEEDN